MSLSDNSHLSTSSTSLSTTDSTDTSLTEIKTKVDRRILDTMISGGNQTLESADDFFLRVANETGASIAYPLKHMLEKIGRREPEIRLFGTPSQVQTARQIILDTIGPYKNRVTLKIDVSHFDHSHVIGKGGKRISGIMKATDTHVHFPDCNRVENEAKSNQVTIAANSLAMAEEARRMIRDNLPLTISFNVEVTPNNMELLNASHPNLQFYQRRYNVLINFKVPEPIGVGSRFVTVQVRGTRLQFDELREAVRSVYTQLNWNAVGFNSMVATIEMDISPQHHPFVQGRGNANIKSINAHTGAIITFPDFRVGSLAVQDLNDGRISIKGLGVDSAYMAWIELMGYLPLMLTFSLSPEHHVDSKLLQDLMTDQDLSIMIRQKLESGGKLLILKTQERHSHILFEARQRILGINEELPPVVQRVKSKTNFRDSSFNLFGGLSFNFKDYETECLRAFKPSAE